jgi:hypothetical protein
MLLLAADVSCVLSTCFVFKKMVSVWVFFPLLKHAQKRDSKQSRTKKDKENAPHARFVLVLCLARAGAAVHRVAFKNYTQKSRCIPSPL